MHQDMSSLADLFHIPCECIQTRGIQDGVILKFATFYLKIYDSSGKDSYTVEGYHYKNNSVLFKDCVPYNRMRQYASQFKM